MVNFNGIERQIRFEKSDLEKIFEGVLNSGQFINGDNVRLFEVDFAKFLGVEEVISTGSGTSSLEIVSRFLAKLGYKKIATAANAGGYASLAAFAANMDVILIDCDIESGLVTKEKLDKVFSQSPFDVLVYTHLYGNCENMSEIVEFCEQNRVTLVEDCAQSIGLKSDLGITGSIGDYSCFSFYPTKNLGALGDGGAIVAKSQENSAKLRMLKQYGWNQKYSIEESNGTNSRMDEIQAAILRYRLPLLNDWNLKRLSILNSYISSMHESWGRFLNFNASVAHLAVFSSKNLEATTTALKLSGIEIGRYYPVSDNNQKAWRDYFYTQKVPNSEYLCARAISLPCHPFLTELEIKHVCEILSVDLSSKSVK